MAPPDIRKVIVLYDGTWCGRQTNTRSNIYLLAQMIGIDMTARPAEYTSADGGIHARYFDGVGSEGDFINYLWNGAFATQARAECTEVYRYIVQNFVWTDQLETQVWMFGISRGAYIVRSVGGLINNCGIIDVTNPDNIDLVDQVYDIYRNPHPVHHPSSSEMVQFRDNVSYHVPTPIKFMGLFDTVGSRGIPRLNYNTGTGFEWPEFYDEKVSTAVEKVYHAVAIHDRLWAFQPCLASRDPRHACLQNHKIYQKWFPGCHYDLARQEFQFLREGGSWVERFSFPILNLFNETVLPNHKLADLVLIWILEGIRTEGGGDLIRLGLDGRVLPLPSIDSAINQVQQQLTGASSTGTGDMYHDIPSYLPGGRLISTLIRRLGRFGETASNILFRPVERMIPDHGINNANNQATWNQVYNYSAPDPRLPGSPVVEQIAGVDGGRYPSQTLQNFQAYMAAVGRNPWG